MGSPTKGKIVTLFDGFPFVNDDGFKFVDVLVCMVGGFTLWSCVAVVGATIGSPISIVRRIGTCVFFYFGRGFSLHRSLGSGGEWPHVNLERILYTTFELFLYNTAAFDFVVKAIHLHTQYGGQLADADGLGHLARQGAASTRE